MTTDSVKLMTIAIMVTAQLASVQPVAYAVSKTPNLNNSILLEMTEPFEMPKDYPQDLLDFYANNIDARSYIVVDQATDKVLAQGDANIPYPIASMTKVLSTYLVYKAIDEGKLSMDDTIQIPDEILDGISSNPVLSNAWLEPDVDYTVRDLIVAVLMVSANDATSALMWEIYGSEQAAVQAMIDQLAEWNITNVGMYSTSGAPNLDVPESFWMPGSNEYDQNTMSAGDVALMTKHVIEEYPEILDITQLHEYTFMEGTPQEQVYYTTNQLLEGGAYARQNVTGLKSGYTDEAGRNFVATGSQDGRNYIAVAMGVFGEGMSSYWEIEILLDGLLEYPHLYEKNLPLNIHEQTLILEETTDEVVEEVEETTEVENLRDNPLTNFMKGIYNIFN